MHTDSPFYRLFQERPALVFELAGLPVPADLAYRLHAEEVKQTAFRLDGVLRPEAGRDDLPLIFVDVITVETHLSATRLPSMALDSGNPCRNDG